MPPTSSPGRIVVRSAMASHIDLCLFDDARAPMEARRIPLIRNGDRWTRDVTLPHGQLYALRARGPSSIATRAHFEPERLLLDPYARAIGRMPSPLDPLGAVVIDDFDWQDDAPPAIAWRDTVIYEAHVKGMTVQHPDVRPDHRGTFLGLTAPAVLAHLRDLGVTAVELLPVHAHADEPALTLRGLTNYWGYNTLSFFAPDPRFATAAVETDPSAAVREFKTMVRALHRAGIEVILDVVYNHTAEGPVAAPALSWRGLDPVRTYRRHAHDPTEYEDWTGCGNTLNLDDPIVRGMVLDSLRYWVTEMHVDGFRFDLASALDRAPGQPGSFFSEVQHDPILSRVKLIAEPWDATAAGYRLGRFPPGMAEWNDRYRDAVRRFWRGDAGATPEFATRLCGSDDLFGMNGGTPQSSVNFVTSHDGFTLADLVSYSEKHNEANGEHNADGDAHNSSSNAGVEGPSDDPAVLAARATRQRSLLATLALSLGVPMFSGGDEVGRTQLGNNNAYCQDGPISWTPWPGDAALCAFLCRALALRRAHPSLRRDTFRTASDVTWLSAGGAMLTEVEWRSPHLPVFGMELVSGGAGALLMYANAGRDAVTCTLPAGIMWTCVLNSAAPEWDAAPVGPQCIVAAGSLVVLTPTAAR
jgi:glycogen operon protein